MVQALLLAAAAAAPSQELCGSLEQQGPIEVLNLWGGWEDMGYAQGYLLAPRIKLVYETYMVELAGGVSNIDALRLFYTQHFDTPEGFGLLADRVRALADRAGAGLGFVLEGGYGLDTLSDGIGMVHETFDGREPVESTNGPAEDVTRRIERAQEIHGLD